MSQDDWNGGNEWDRDNPPERFDHFPGDEPAPVRQGMSSGMKVLIVLLCLFGGGLFLCCGGIAVFVYLSMPKMAHEPADVIALRKEIADVELPVSLEPRHSMRMDNFFMAMKAAVYESPDSKRTLVLAELTMKFGDANDMAFESVSKQLKTGRPQQEDIVIRESKTRKLKVRGEERDFHFELGEDTKSGKKFRLVTGAFPGRAGTTFLVYSAEEDAYNEEEILKIIESIR